MRKSVQMYAIRALAERDMEKALQIVAQIGYEGVEFAGFFGHSAKQIKEWLDKYGLVVSGAHVAAELIFDKTEETIAFHKEICNNRIICPGVHMENAADVAALADKYKAVAPAYHAAGMSLGYHNHAHEFVRDNQSGEYLIDLLARDTDSKTLQLEFDVYWVYRGGENGAHYLEKYKDRISVWHAKDGTMTDGTALGEGNVDLKSVFSVVKAQKLDWAVVESEASEVEAEQVEAITNDYKALVRFMAD